MKFKITALFLLPLAVAFVLADSAQAKTHKIQVRMTGCLEQGTSPNTFVLNNITKGYTHRNQTGIAPQALARTDDFVIVSDKADLQKHVGQKVKVKGWMSGERSETYTALDAEGNPVVTPTFDAYGNPITPSATVSTSEFKVTKIHKISGSCR